MSIATNVPDVIAAGDTVQWTRNLSDYPSPDWLLSYAFISQVGLFAAQGADNGDRKHLVVIDAADSKLFVPGQYTWTEAVSKGTERFTTGQGTIEVTPDYLSTAAPTDTRTHARIVLDAIEAVLQNTATTDQASYSIGDGVSISRMPVADLLAFRDRYRWLVQLEENAERARKGLSPRWNIGVRL